MIIAVDGFDLTRRSTGVGRFLKNLMTELADLDDNHRYTLYLREDPGIAFPAGRVEPVVLPFDGGYLRWQNGPLLGELKKRRFDLHFFPGNHLPFWGCRPSLLTLHDVAWRARPGEFSLKERLGRELKSRLSLARADQILTDSEFSRSEIVCRYRVDPGRVSVVRLGVEERFQPAGPEEKAAFRERYGLGDGPVIGFLGSMFSRRHVADIVAAWEALPRESAGRLFLVGRNFCGPELQARLQRPGLVWRERLEEAEINAFYSALDLFLYPSDYEGFGLPPLEALACGTVPLLVDATSLGEIFAGLALFVERADPPSLAGAILDFRGRREEISAGVERHWRERRGEFTWPRVALEYRRSFEALAGPAPRR